VVGVEQWAELRREHFVGGKSIKELARSTGLSRTTIRRAIRTDRPPTYVRARRSSVLEPFKDEIHRLLRDDPRLPGVRVRELLAPLGCSAGKTVVDDYLREVRPLFAPPARTFQRIVFRRTTTRPVVVIKGSRRQNPARAANGQALSSSAGRETEQPR
jgi:hypothetical protein